jgi:endonuclease I/V8-like Glu-specific endopeptidase
MAAFDDQVRRAIERVSDDARDSESVASSTKAILRGELAPTAIEDPLRIARRAVSAGFAPTVGAVLAPVGGPTTAETLAAVYERVLGEADFLGSRFLFTGAARAEAVCRVVIRSASRAVVGYGTGFLVSPSVVMTNNHVLESADQAAPSAIQFGYREDVGGTLHPVVEFDLDPARLFETSVELDFTLVAVEPSNGSGQRVDSNGWIPLLGGSGKSLTGERVNIIQHPSGEPQQVVIHDNLIIEVVDDFLRYVADTRRGSSGSPVFNNDWDLAALHHSGVPRTDDQGRILLTSGAVWDGSDAQRDLIDWVSNEGVRISSIVEHLKGLPAQPELATVLNPPPQPDHASRAPAGATEAVSLGPVVGPSIAGSTARWSVPVEVALELPPPAGDATPPAPPTAVGAASPDYYDETSDLHAVIAYYDSINPDAAANEVFSQLQSLLESTHTRVFDYAEARLDHLYPSVDLHPDGKLHSVYSDTPFDAQEIIAADVEIEAQRSTRLRAAMSGEATLSTERLEELVTALEAELMFNCEHVVPQSWFNKAQPMRADLHHLFTCEAGCNSFRSNIPYWDFPPEIEAVRTDCGQLQGRKFEPDIHHGAVARATLYFLVRHPGLIAPTEAEMPTDRLATLLKWHETDPPSLWERHRNATIADAQGNRNPLIDHPDWSQQIDFALGFSS